MNDIPVGRRYAVVYYGGSNDYITKLILERNYTIVIAQPFFVIPKEWIRHGVKVYAYLNILGLPIEKLDWVKKNHPEWLLYTKDGEIAKYWFGKAFMCNIAVKSFQDYLINKAKEYLERGFTGVFLDDVHPEIKYLGGGLYDTPVYDETKYGRWIDALVHFMNRLKNETSASLIYNAGWDPPSPELMSVVDGVMLEGHPGTWKGNPWKNPQYYYRPWSDILRVSIVAQKYAKEGKIVVALSYGDNESIYEYTYAAVRLFDFYYWITTPIINRTLNAEVLNIDLGNPLGDYELEGGVYYRIYDRGLVAINPYSKEYTAEIKVPSNWLELARINGEVYKVNNGTLKVSLKAHEGIVLLLKKVGKSSQSASRSQQGIVQDHNEKRIIDILRAHEYELMAIFIALMTLVAILIDYWKRHNLSKRNY